MPSLTIEPAPFANSVDEQGGVMSAPWARWIQLALIPRVQQAAPSIVAVRLTNQAASIGATAVVAAATAGLYRVSWFVRVVQAATVNSAITVSVGFTDGSVSCSQSGAALAGNTTSTCQSGMVLLRAAGATPITFATTYASVGGVPMHYNLDVIVEQVQ